MTTNTQSRRFFRTEDRQDVFSTAITDQELTEARVQGNPCHDHFLEYRAKELLWCYICGRFYYDGIDITEYPHETL